MLLEDSKVGIARDNVNSIYRLCKREQIEILSITDVRFCLIYDVDCMAKGTNNPHQILHIAVLDIATYLVTPCNINYFICQLRTDKHLKPHISHYAANRLQLVTYKE